MLHGQIDPVLYIPCVQPCSTLTLNNPRWAGEERRFPRGGHSMGGGDGMTTIHVSIIGKSSISQACIVHT